MFTAERFKDNLPKGAATEELQKSFLGKNVLFYIERSNNANTVIYEANMQPNGGIDANDPIKVYWIMYAKNPAHEEGLTIIERNTAYGSSCKKNEAAGSGHFQLTITALKENKIDVSIDGEGRLSAKTLVNGNEANLLKIFVQSTTSWGIPKVDYIDITGRASDGSIITERKKA